MSVLIALGAGLLSFLSPCVLPLVPSYVTHLSASAAGKNPGGRWQPLAHAALFVGGFSLVFIVLGASVGLVGFLVSGSLPVLRRVAGVILVLLGIHMLGILRIPHLHRERRLDVKGGSMARSFLVGVTFSLGWTPCIGPVLGGILTLAWSSQTVGQGALLLMSYSAGLAVPFLLVGVALAQAQAVVRRLHRYSRWASVASGLLLIAMGIMIFFNLLTTLNPYFDPFGLGAGI